MIKYPTPIFLLLICASIIHAQDKRRNNSLSLEIGKTGLIYNLTYDHHFSNNFGLRAGGGSNFSSNLQAITAGGGIYYLTGKSKRHFESGIDFYYLGVFEASDDQKSIALIYPNYYAEGLLTNINLGYRTYGKKTMFRIGGSPALFKGEFIPGGYISFGIRF
jgi:hypothetical protein